MEVTGYEPNEKFYATRYWQGGRRVFALDLSLMQIAYLIPKPQVGAAAEGNREIKEKHAMEFGAYIRERTNWVAPALVLRAPDIFTFETRESIEGTEFGVLAFPKLASSDLRILDGQHRILGIHLAIEAIGREIEKARSFLAAARRTDESGTVIATAQEQIATLNAQREKFSRERTSIQIYVEEDQMGFKQMFYDIAENALGISLSVKARFDSTKVVNRTLDEVMKHELLDQRVDLQQDRILKSNPNLVGARQVAEIVRTLAVGIDGRVSKRGEAELREQDLVQSTNDFLDALLEAFPPLEQIVAGELTPEKLRGSSLLGSTVMLRVLAGVFYQLRSSDFDDDRIVGFFEKLAPFMRGPVRDGDVWLELVEDDLFVPGALSPRSRRQDLKVLQNAIVEWAQTDPAWLSTPTVSIISES